MWSRERRAALHRLIEVAAALGLAAGLAGCFQPLYGDHSPTSGTSLRGALASVEVVPIEAPGGTPLARIAVEFRNDLTFALYQGAGPAPPVYRLLARLGTGASSLIVDPNTGRPEYDVVAVDASYQLVEIASGKPVLTGNATSRVTYDIPGQQQRFNIIRGQRNSQSRATQVVVEQIRNRLASYFATGS